MTHKRSIETANTIRERAGMNRFKIWLLMSGNRLLVAALLTATVFGLFVVAAAVFQGALPHPEYANDLIERLFTTMIIVIGTGATLVVAFGQLVLSQDNGPLGDQHEHMAASMEFRELAEDLIGSPSSAIPAVFLGDILEVTSQRAAALQDTMHFTDGEAHHEELRQLTDSIIGNADHVCEQLEGSQFGTFDVVYAALHFDYSWKIYQIERIANEFGAQFSDEEHAGLTQLKDVLLVFGPVREHVKTLYFQWALVGISELILYTAVPALAMAGIMVALVDAGTIAGATLGVNHVFLLIGAGFAVTLVPFMLFTAYILRIFTVAKRTLAIEPLIPRKADQ